MYPIELTGPDGEKREWTAEIAGTLVEREKACHAIARDVERAVLEASLRSGQPACARPTCCGRPMKKSRLRSRKLLTPVGVVDWSRRVFVCPSCGRHAVPQDALLAVPTCQVSPRLTAIALDLVAVQPYDKARAQLERLYGVHVATGTLENLASRVRPAALAFEEAALEQGMPASPVKRLYVGCDGVMVCSNQLGSDGKLQWREVKVGCCFWTDPDGTFHKRILGRFESASSFGDGLRRWADRYGMATAQEVVFIGDGAEWIWNLAARHVNEPKVTWVLDGYHVTEHLWEAARALHPEEQDQPESLVNAWKGVLRSEGGRRLWQTLRTQLQGDLEAEDCTALTKLIGYIQPRMDQMDYPAYRAREMYIGSGAVESAVKQLVAMRAKGPGMQWKAPDGIQAVLSLRAIQLNGEWGCFWDQNPLRRAA